jgi:hypothetical protein
MKMLRLKRGDGMTSDAVEKERMPSVFIQFDGIVTCQRLPDDRSPNTSQ